MSTGTAISPGGATATRPQVQPCQVEAAGSLPSLKLATGWAGQHSTQAVTTCSLAD